MTPAQFVLARKKMDTNATWIVLGLGTLFHVFLNVLPYMINDSLLKVEAPIITLVTIIAVYLGFRIFGRHH